MSHNPKITYTYYKLSTICGYSFKTRGLYRTDALAVADAERWGVKDFIR